MNPILIALWLLPVAGAVYLLSLLASRKGNTAHHTRAFYSGVVGLLSIPIWLTALAGMMRQLLWATFASLAGVLFIASSIAMTVAGVASIMCLVQLRCAR